MPIPIGAAIYTLTMNELRKMGTKAALKEIAKRTAKKLKKEGLKTAKSKTGIDKAASVVPGARVSDFLKRRNTLASNMSGMTKTKPNMSSIDKKLSTAGKVALGFTGGAIVGKETERSQRIKQQEKTGNAYKIKTEEGQKPSNLQRKRTAAQKFKNRYGK